MSTLGDDLIEGMQEMLAHMRGEDTGATVHKVKVETVDTKAIRSKYKMTQADMAMVLGTSLSGYKKWEQGQRRPSGVALTLLKIMDKEPEAVKRALAS